tara:strand:- start:2932 stop:3555 length:624 start_codon:yes stop_codon:yes gene_type:complete
MNCKQLQGIILEQKRDLKKQKSQLRAYNAIFKKLASMIISDILNAVFPCITDHKELFVNPQLKRMIKESFMYSHDCKLTFNHKGIEFVLTREKDKYSSNTLAWYLDFPLIAWEDLNGRIEDELSYHNIYLNNHYDTKNVDLCFNHTQDYTLSTLAIHKIRESVYSGNIAYLRNEKNTFIDGRTYKTFLDVKTIAETIIDAIRKYNPV